MSQNKDRQNWLDLIERQVDGEISVEEARQLESALDHSSELSSIKSALLEMRELVRFEVEAAADSVDLDFLWARLEPSLRGAEVEPQVASADIMAFADGELSGSELSQLTERLSQSPIARKRLAALNEVGELVRASVAHAVEQTDFAPLWSRLESAVSKDMEARSGLAVTPSSQTERPRNWVQRFVEAIGGYRALGFGAATAAVMLAILLPLTVFRSDGGDGDENPALEIRVVHVNEARAAPGYEVTVESDNGVAPVIYIRPDQSQAPEPTDRAPHAPQRDPYERFNDPI